MADLDPRNAVLTLAEIAAKLIQALDTRITTMETVPAETSILTLQARSTDPANPDNGKSIIWMSDGTATGANGDVLMKITVAGVTKILMISEFSILN